MKADTLPKKMNGSLLLFDTGSRRYESLNFPYPIKFSISGDAVKCKKKVPGEFAQSDLACQYHFSGVLDHHKYDPSAKNFTAGRSHQKSSFAHFPGLAPRLF